MQCYGLMALVYRYVQYMLVMTTIVCTTGTGEEDDQAGYVLRGAPHRGRQGAAAGGLVPDLPGRLLWHAIHRAGM